MGIADAPHCALSGMRISALLSQIRRDVRDPVCGCGWIPASRISKDTKPTYHFVPTVAGPLHPDPGKYSPLPVRSKDSAPCRHILLHVLPDPRTSRHLPAAACAETEAPSLDDDEIPNCVIHRRSGVAAADGGGVRVARARFVHANTGAGGRINFCACAGGAVGGLAVPVALGAAIRNPSPTCGR